MINLPALFPADAKTKTAGSAIPNP